MLGATGYASGAFEVLRSQGWDAFLQLQAAQRRARRRLPWRRSGALAAAAGGAGAGAEAGAAGEPAGEGDQEQPSEEEEREQQFLPAQLQYTAGQLRRVLQRTVTLTAGERRRRRALLQTLSSRGPLAFGGALVDFPELAAKQQEAVEEEEEQQQQADT